MAVIIVCFTRPTTEWSNVVLWICCKHLKFANVVDKNVYMAT